VAEIKKDEVTDEAPILEVKVVNQPEEKVPETYQGDIDEDYLEIPDIEEVKKFVEDEDYE